jgi:opacity protein-like surface antigen
MAAAAALAAAPGQAQGQWLLNRWEVEVDTGVQFNQRYGGPSGRCTGAGALNPITLATTDDCRPGLDNSLQEALLGLDSSDELSTFQQNVSTHYRTGQTAGVRLGVDITRRVQIEFRYSYGRSNMAFDSRFYRAALEAVRRLDPAAIAPVQAVIVSEGQPQGHLKYYQWDLVYHLRDRDAHKLVPYVMGGAGFFRMGNGPSFEVLTLDSDGSLSGGGPGTPLIQTRVDSDADTAFAFSFGVGAKYYFTRHLGVRLEARNSVAFPSFHHRFSSQAVSNFIAGSPGQPGPLISPSGTVSQNDQFNSIDLKAGFLVRF